MLRKVIWSDRALRDLKAILNHIASDSPVNAKQVGTRLVYSTRILAEFPNVGRVIPEKDDPQFRELIEPPYRVMYRVSDKAVDILAIRHSKQGTLPGLDH